MLHAFRLIFFHVKSLLCILLGTCSYCTINRVPPGHPCLFLFPFLLVFPFPFDVLRFPLPFRFLVFPFVSCIAFLAFPFASLLSLVADSVLLSRCYTPPALRASLTVCVFPLCAAFFLACEYLFFLPFLPFFRFRFWTSFVSSFFFLVWVYSIYY